jgi:hypothetical protein
MKRLFQFVALAIVLLAAAQPLLANTACTQPRCEGSPDCSTHFDSTAIPNSGMQYILASSPATSSVVFPEAGCGYGTCWLESDSATLLAVTPPTSRLASRTFLMPVAPFSASQAVILAAGSPQDVAAGAVPRHILFQVFRI